MLCNKKITKVFNKFKYCPQIFETVTNGMQNFVKCSTKINLINKVLFYIKSSANVEQMKNSSFKFKFLEYYKQKK